MNALNITIREISLPLIVFGSMCYLFTLNREITNLIAFCLFIVGLVIVGVFIEEIVKNGVEQRRR